MQLIYVIDSTRGNKQLQIESDIHQSISLSHGFAVVSIFPDHDQRGSTLYLLTIMYINITTNNY